MPTPALPKTPTAPEAANAWARKLAKAARQISDDEGNVSLKRAETLEKSRDALAAWGDNIANYLRATGRAEASVEEIIRSGHKYASVHFGRAAGRTRKVSFDRAERKLPRDLRLDFLVLRGKAPRASATAPNVRISSRDEGYKLSRVGDSYRIEIDTARAPAEGELTLHVDDHAITLQKWPGGLATYEIPRLMPKGYGADVVSRDRQRIDRSGRQIVTLRISRDPADGLTEARALKNARNALVDEAKRMMREDRNWRAYFPTTWSRTEADGIMDGIRSFPAGEGEDGEVYRHTDQFTFTGRGPYGLYSEVSVDKSTGDIRRAYIEID